MSQHNPSHCGDHSTTTTHPGCQLPSNFQGFSDGCSDDHGTNYSGSSNGQTAHLEQAIRLVADDMHAHIAALQCDNAAMQHRLNQLNSGVHAPLFPSSPLPIMPVVTGPDTKKYARKLGFANLSDVDAAYRKDPQRFANKLKTILYEALVPHRWTETPVIEKMKAWFNSHGITLELIAAEGGHDNFKSVEDADLVVRGELISKHLRAHN